MGINNLDPILISYPTSVVQGNTFTWGITQGPINGNWYATNNYNERVPVSGVYNLDAAGAATYTNGTLSRVGTYNWTWYFNDGRTSSKSVQVTCPVYSPSYEIQGPSSVNQGDTLVFNLTSNHQTLPTSVNWVLANPNGSWLSKAPSPATNTGSVILGGAADYAAYVQSYQDLVIAYYDSVNGTQYYAEAYGPNGHIGSHGPTSMTGQQQYDQWMTGTDFTAAAKLGIEAWGLNHWTRFGITEGRILPVSSQLSGTTMVSDTTSGVISLYVNTDHRTDLAQYTITLNALGQSKTVTINNTAQSLMPQVNEVAKKLAGTGDFIDSSLTYQAAVYNYTYITDGKSISDIVNDPTSAGKLLINSSQRTLANTYALDIVNYYRNPAKLNRNPDLGGMIYWIGDLFRYQTDTTFTSPQVYNIGSIPLTTASGVWVNPATAALGNQWQSISRNWTGTVAGTYYMSVACDNRCIIYIDGKQIVDNYLGQPTTIPFTVPAGNHVVRVDCLNVENGQGWAFNPGYWSVRIGTKATYVASTTTPAYYNPVVTADVVWDAASAPNLAAQSITVPGTGMTEANAYLTVHSIIDKICVDDGKPVGSRTQFLACNTDPLSQTFFVPAGIYPNGLFLIGIGLYFNAKDTDLPVFAQIRPTVNGYPSSSVVIPLSTVWKKPNEIITSSNASVETIFQFSDPVYLQPGEYAIVTGSNSNKYEAFYATIGENQLGTSNKISSQPNVGSLFKSQNASTWTADQTSDLTFKLYKANFNTTGTFEAVFINSAPTKKFDYEVVNVTSKELDFNDTTDITYNMKNTVYGNPIDTSYTPILANKNYYLKSTKTNANTADTKIVVNLSTTDVNVSPVIDKDRMSMIMVHNIINNTTDLVIPETLNSGGNAAAKYVTRFVTLADEFDATGVTVYFNINRQPGSSVEVYGKFLAGDDNDSLDNKHWQLIPSTYTNPQYSVNDTDFMEDQYRVTNFSYSNNGVTYHSFQTFAIKVVMYSNNPAVVPQIMNFRAIATS